MYTETESGWFYNTCKSYSGKVVDMGSGKFSCESCNIPVKYVVPSYRVTFRVEDDTGYASIVMFDREITKLLNKSALALIENMMKEGESDLFPQEFDQLLDK
ncbi:hypothetical protein vseg_007823 [Gypsophila vaccaria]